MVDITMCEGKGCELKYKCYRHTANKSMRQSFFMNEPNTTPIECVYYWDNK